MVEATRRWAGNLSSLGHIAESLRRPGNLMNGQPEEAACHIIGQQSSLEQGGVSRAAATGHFQRDGKTSGCRVSGGV